MSINTPPVSPRIQEICRLNEECQRSGSAFATSSKAFYEAAKNAQEMLERNVPLDVVAHSQLIAARTQAEKDKTAVERAEWHIGKKTFEYAMGNGDIQALASALYPNDSQKQAQYLGKITAIFFKQGMRL